MAVPKTYRKLVATTLTTNFREAAEIVAAEMPTPRPDEVIVKNHYAGVNASDVTAATGSYFPGQPPPIDLGIETAGEVVAVGSEVQSLKIGAAVITSRAGFGYREYTATKARHAISVPEATPEYMSLVVSALTASIALEQVGEMAAEDVVLVTAAAGGTGQYAVQLAHLAGNHVIGTCGSGQKAAMLRELGCDRVINYREEDVYKVLKEEYPQGVDVVYENVGGKLFDTAVKHLAVKGRLIIIGYVSEYVDGPQCVEDYRIYTHLLRKSASVRGFFIFHYKEQIPEHTRRLIEQMQSGAIRAVIDPTEFQGMESIVDAVEYLHSGQNCGKVVVRY